MEDPNTSTDITNRDVMDGKRGRGRPRKGEGNYTTPNCYFCIVELILLPPAEVMDARSQREEIKFDPSALVKAVAIQKLANYEFNTTLMKKPKKVRKKAPKEIVIV